MPSPVEAEDGFDKALAELLGRLERDIVFEHQRRSGTVEAPVRVPAACCRMSRETRVRHALEEERLEVTVSDEDIPAPPDTKTSVATFRMFSHMSTLQESVDKEVQTDAAPRYLRPTVIGSDPGTGVMRTSFGYSDCLDRQSVRTPSVRYSRHTLGSEEMVMSNVSSPFEVQETYSITGGLVGKQRTIDRQFLLAPIWNEDQDMEDYGAPPKITLLSVLKTGSNQSRGSLAAEGQVYGLNQDRQTVTLFGDSVEHSGWARRFIMHPETRRRFAWIMAGISFMIYDLFMIPVELTFKPYGFDSLTWLAYVSSGFWTLDMVFNFFVGVHSEGIVDMRPRIIAKAYLAGWFWVDAFIVLTDWVFIVITLVQTEMTDNPFGIARAGRSFRMIRLLRFVRVIRIAKLMKLSGIMMDSLTSEYFVMLAKIFRLVFGIIIMNHYVACAWYFIGSMQLEEGEITWLHEAHLVGESGPAQYFASLHWSLTQFTPATNKIAPETAAERFFACFVVLFALVTFSTFLSHITTAMTKLLSINQQKSLDESKIREFFRSNRVPLPLANRIWDCWRKRCAQTVVHISKESVPFFMDMPESLKMQLNYELYRGKFKIHPVFKEAFYKPNDHDTETYMFLCHQAVTECLGGAQKDVFSEGMECKCARLVISGRLDYYQQKREEEECWVPKEYPVEENQWLSEGALWGRWVHRGKLLSATSYRVMEVNAYFFQLVVADHHELRAGFGAYAREWTLEGEAHGYTDITDVNIMAPIAKGAFKRSEIAKRSSSPMIANHFPLSPSSSARKMMGFGRPSGPATPTGSKQSLADNGPATPSGSKRSVVDSSPGPPTPGSSKKSLEVPEANSMLRIQRDDRDKTRSISSIEQ